ncbi:MAG: 1A family penicillin-binding protein [Parcubacteria group bacterium Gr01-1014_18]|nr:MAG: 1A family penicillin-binding protein [Parcubacteria group bacterium Greene0416_36]TSC81164.1 MAG: 1A family penicillin-binding protein [Parcubacteria group bacterium Gr01-1014_18]TSC99161.1 MAG: 1A family penicillin-binding protein [Parcubacteria group bacterium Greene1014_20]TSD07481.1 MAG: 1A family penicillin-binding protein [Parcubacteria group bacterium Greene0714_2]
MSVLRSPNKWRGSKYKLAFSSNFWSVFVYGIIFAVSLGIFALVGLFIYFGRDLPDPNRLADRRVVESTKIYDRTGEHLLYEIHGDRSRTIVKLEEVPKHVVWSVIALEDKDFLEKKLGLSFGRTVFAVFQYGFGKITGRGGGGAGGSGLTQQLIKNAILGPEKTISRKIREWILTVQIERKFNKDEILQMYFNEIPYGGTAYGIESASLYYFGKPAKDLVLAESALLAAIIQRPTYFSPYGSHLDELLARKNLVLGLMKEQGYIDDLEYSEARDYGLKFKNKIEKIEAPHFVFFVREFLTDKYGEKLVEEGGLRVRTTLDYDIQKKAEESIEKNFGKASSFGATNAALVSIDPVTGDILAMVGSRDYFDLEHDGNVNVSTRPRQPGSSFKPIVYAGAFSKGYTPETIVYDVETIFETDTKDYIPKNYNLREYGPVTLRRALAGSLNIAAVKVLYLTGVSNVLDFAERLGYTTLGDRSRFGLSLVLGGGEVTLLEHVGAYTAFAQDGVRSIPRSILSVEDNNGKLLEEFAVVKKKAMDPEPVRVLVSVMSDNEARSFVFGMNNRLTLKNRVVAAKTGTTNDNRDAWTVGFVPELAAGVWVGNNNNDKMKQGADGSVIAAPIWQSFMESVLSGKKTSEFPKVSEKSSSLTLKPILRGILPDYKLIDIDSVSGLLATPLTPPELVIQKIYRTHHSILHYLKKDDPRGEAPADPAKADSAYLGWEQGIARWVEREKAKLKEPVTDPKKASTLPKTEKICSSLPAEDGTVVESCRDLEILWGDIPTEYDNIHVVENFPIVSILSPGQGSVITQDEIFFRAGAGGSRAIASVEYYIGDNLVGTVKSSPFDFLYQLGELPNGFYTAKAVAKDDIGNSAKSSIFFQVSRTKAFGLAQWMRPLAGDLISLSAFPYKITLLSNRFVEIDKVEVFGERDFGGQKILGIITSPTGALMALDWHFAEKGKYTLTTKLQMKDKTILDGPSVSVVVE